MKETLEFNNKKQCGLWLMLIGVILIVSVLLCGIYLFFMSKPSKFVPKGKA